MAKRYKHELSRIKEARRAAFVVEYVKDFSARRAAEAVGYQPDTGYQIVNDPDIQEAIRNIVEERMEVIGINAEWVLFELVDNHRIARQQGNITASNTALLTIAKHISVDALAKQKIEIDDVTDKDLLERLHRGRKRLGQSSDDDEVTFL